MYKGVLGCRVGMHVIGICQWEFWLFIAVSRAIVHHVASSYKSRVSLQHTMHGVKPWGIAFSLVRLNGPNYIYVSLSCTFLGPVQTMPKSRGEASFFWTKLCWEEKPLGWKSILIHHRILNILMKKSSASRQKFGSSILLERLNSWRHSFLKVLPPRLPWRRHPLDFSL